MSEVDLIRWLQERVGPTSRSPVSVGIGDDAALLGWIADRELVLATDMILEGSCFLLEHGLGRIGRKALAINLSDLAAMAAEPLAALVSLALPRSFSLSMVQEIYEGLLGLAEEFGVALVGGDTNTWNGPLAVNVSVVGLSKPGTAVLRRGAQPGDWLLVTGPLGGSILGKHLNFTPRVREARRLVELVQLHAMIDISDGLARDLHRLCEASRCGAVLYVEQIPISSEAYQLSDHREPLEHALSDGEDFELLFAVAPEDGQRLLQQQPLRDLNVTLYHIGECIERGVYLRRAKGELQDLPPLGYLHSFAD
ncbi:MAG: thiamine-phosphate kinase [Gemmatales bacterium]|nr:thiamine-phosphate kinase [Gemmatales bacterium]MDW8222551.1 thiamine-phosphate kinase [Gemmatales bacterium]